MCPDPNTIHFHKSINFLVFIHYIYILYFVITFQKYFTLVHKSFFIRKKINYLLTRQFWSYFYITFYEYFQQLKKYHINVFFFSQSSTIF